MSFIEIVINGLFIEELINYLKIFEIMNVYKSCKHFVHLLPDCSQWDKTTYSKHLLKYMADNDFHAFYKYRKTIKAGYYDWPDMCEYKCHKLGLTPYPNNKKYPKDIDTLVTAAIDDDFEYIKKMRYFESSGFDYKGIPESCLLGMYIIYPGLPEYPKIVNFRQCRENNLLSEIELEEMDLNILYGTVREDYSPYDNYDIMNKYGCHEGSIWDIVYYLGKENVRKGIITLPNRWAVAEERKSGNIFGKCESSENYTKFSANCDKFKIKVTIFQSAISDKELDTIDTFNIETYYINPEYYKKIDVENILKWLKHETPQSIPKKIRYFINESFSFINDYIN